MKLRNLQSKLSAGGPAARRGGGGDSPGASGGDSAGNSLGNSLGTSLARKGFGTKLGKVLSSKDVESPELLRDPDTKAVLAWIRGRQMGRRYREEQTGRVRTQVYQAHLCDYMQTIVVKEIHIVDYSR